MWSQEYKHVGEAEIFSKLQLCVTKKYNLWKENIFLRFCTKSVVTPDSDVVCGERALYCPYLTHTDDRNYMMTSRKAVKSNPYSYQHFLDGLEPQLWSGTKDRAAGTEPQNENSPLSLYRATETVYNFTPNHFHIVYTWQKMFGCSNYKRNLMSRKWRVCDCCKKIGNKFAFHFFTPL
jgi:hypothetical protein